MTDDRHDDDAPGEDWERTPAATSLLEREAAIARTTDHAILDLLQQLARDPQLTDRERARAMRFAMPKIRELVRREMGPPQRVQ